MKECILIVNHDTGEYRLEKLNSNIAVKKTRWVDKLVTNHVTTVLLFYISSIILTSVICIHASVYMFPSSFNVHFWQKNRNEDNLQLKTVFFLSLAQMEKST